MEDLAYEMNLAAARLAREAADAATARRRTGRASSPAPSARPTARPRSRPTSITRATARSTFDQLVEAYPEQARGLIEGGVDLLLVETIFDTLNAKAAGFAVSRCSTNSASSCR